MSEVRAISPRLGHARHFLTGGFCLLALVVVMAFWFAHQTRMDAAAAQTILIEKQHIADVQATVRQAETGQRGYLLTGNPDYLVQYTAALPLLPPAFHALEAALGQGPEAGDVAMLKQLANIKMAELARTVALYQAGRKEDALALVQTNLGQNVMDQLRALVGKMEAAQSVRLAVGQRADMLNGWLLQFTTTLAVIATLLLAWLAIRENRLQNAQLHAAQAALIETNASLERKVEERTLTLRESRAALADANASLELRVAERSGELDRIFRMSADILAVLGFDGVFRSVSPAWETITLWPIEKAYEMPFLEFLHPDDLQATIDGFERVKTGERLMDFENRYRRPNGDYVWLSWRVVPVLQDQLVYLIARDVTGEKAREERLRQSQKMQVVGQLTGGIAHDFNNLLTIIMGSLEMLQRGMRDAEPRLAKRLDNAMDGAKRAAALTHRLLAFSRQQPLAPKPVEVNRLLAGMSDMLARTLGEHVAIELVAGAGLWPAMADGNQLENALLNLAVNARDAMPDGGRLTVETQNAYLDEAYAAGKDVRPGQYVQIAATDTGTGMTADVRAKVFEPFFTTKTQGQGTGLGLAQVYGFIKQSGGHVAIYSELGQGTTVKLYLPRLKVGAALEAPAAEPPAPDLEQAGNGETILLVEDEAGVRHFATEVLQELGYNVLAAENAAAALEIFEHVPGIGMLFTDVVLTGGMNGRLLANEILRRAPDIIVLFTTGYTRNAIIHHGRLDEGINFIGKPFTAGALARMVRQLFNEGGRGQEAAAFLKKSGAKNFY